MEHGLREEVASTSSTLTREERCKRMEVTADDRMAGCFVFGMNELRCRGPMTWCLTLRERQKGHMSVGINWQYP